MKRRDGIYFPYNYKHIMKDETKDDIRTISWSPTCVALKDFDAMDENKALKGFCEESGVDYESLRRFMHNETPS